MIWFVIISLVILLGLGICLGWMLRGEWEEIGSSSRANGNIFEPYHGT